MVVSFFFASILATFDSVFAAEEWRLLVLLLLLLPVFVFGLASAVMADPDSSLLALNFNTKKETNKGNFAISPHFKFSINLQLMIFGGKSFVLVVILKTYNGRE